MSRPILWVLAGTLAAAGASLGVRRALADRRFDRLDRALWEAPDLSLPMFSERDLKGLPEPAARYLRHAVAPGTPLAPAGRLEMTGAIAPSPGAPLAPLAAVEVLMPRRGFVWTARARVNGMPVRVRDHYYDRRGGVSVEALGVVPLPLGGDGADVARSSRGRLVAEAVWCPTALVHPAVSWTPVDADRARYTLTVDGEPESVTLRVDADGQLREVTLDRWGDPDGDGPGRYPYGFRVEAEQTFDGVTIPTRIQGGWHYGTDRFDPSAAASFTVQSAAWAGGA